MTPGRHAVTKLEHQLVDDGVDENRDANPADDERNAQEQINQFRRRVEALRDSPRPRVQIVDRPVPWRVHSVHGRRVAEASNGDGDQQCGKSEDDGEKRRQYGDDSGTGMG